MRSAFVVLWISVLLLSISCSKEEDGDQSTNSASTEGSKTFSVDFNSKKEPFVGIITRFTCGACGQYGHPNLDQLLEENSNINGAALKYLPTDPLHNEESIEAYSFYPVQGTPTFTLNAEGYGSDITRWKADALADTNNTALVQISMEGEEIAELEYELSVKLLMDPSLENRSVKLALYVMENNIVSQQTDYSRNPNLVENYIHNHVLRDVAEGNFFGEGFSFNNDTIQHNYNLKLHNTVDSKNVYFTAVVWEVNNNDEPIAVLNSQSVRR
jgi:hypothetical protein